MTKITIDKPHLFAIGENDGKFWIGINEEGNVKSATTITFSKKDTKAIKGFFKVFEETKKNMKKELNKENEFSSK